MPETKEKTNDKTQRKEGIYTHVDNECCFGKTTHNERKCKTHDIIMKRKQNMSTIIILSICILRSN